MSTLIKHLGLNKYSVNAKEICKNEAGDWEGYSNLSEEEQRKFDKHIEVVENNSKKN